MHRSLRLNQKEQEKLWRVIKMTKKTAVRSHFNVLFSSIRHWASASVERQVNIDKQRLTSIFTCELKAVYVRSSSSFLYSDLSSDLMLVPQILFINSTGEKKTQHMHKDLKDLDRSERSETKMAALGRDDERLDPSNRVLTVLARISERGCQTLFIRWMTCIHWTAENCKNRTFIFFLSFPTSICNPFLRWFHFNNGRLAEKVSAVLSFR